MAGFVARKAGVCGPGNAAGQEEVGRRHGAPVGAVERQQVVVSRSKSVRPQNWSIFTGVVCSLCAVAVVSSCTNRLMKLKFSTKTNAVQVSLKFTHVSEESSCFCCFKG